MATLTFDAGDNEALAALDFLLEEEGLATVRAEMITRRPAGSRARMSFAQRRLWFLQQLDPASPAYNIAAAVRLQGGLDVSVLEASFEEVARRHETLRSTFHDGPQGPELRIAADLLPSIERLDLADLPPAAVECALRDLLTEQAARPFDLAAGPLVRVCLVGLGPDEHVLALTMHHIVADGWSMGVLVQELGELYAAFLAGRASPLPELPVQSSDHAHWQWEQREGWTACRDYWRGQLANAPTLALPTDRPRPVRPSFAGAIHPLLIPASLLDQVHLLGEEEQATPFMTLLAAFQVLLSRYAGQTDIVVGSPSAGRNRRELEPLIGFFVNTLALRTRWAAGASFREVLRRARATALGAYEHQEIPFDEVIREVLPARESSHHPLFQVMFSVETEMAGPLRFGAVSSVGEPVGAASTAKFDLTLNLAPAAAGLVGGLEYSTALFNPGTVSRLAGHFVRLLDAAVKNPDMPVAELPLLSAEEREQLVKAFNRTDAPLPGGCLGALFTEQVLADPGATAIEFGGERRTYALLHEEAAAWAAELRRRGVGLEDRVAICLEPSIELVVATLAVVLAGAAYVPLSPSHPDARLSFMVRDTGARVLLTQRALMPRLAPLAADVLAMDTALPPTDPAVEPWIPPTPGHLAYVIYTSGSTGEPKGIAVTHGAVVRLVRNTDYVDLGPADRVALASNFAFDAATFELWGALLNGACLVGVPREVALDPARYARLLLEDRVTTLFLTTALFNQLVRHAPGAFTGLRHLLFGGETVDVEAVRALLADAPPTRLLHVYGPTECTTFATWHEVHDVGPDDHTVPIGGPLRNTRAYVLDGTLALVPLGVPGELCLGGPGLARGYVNRPDLTAAVFVPDSFTNVPGGRLYRTGDLVRQRPDGAFEYLGRVDEQVKIRGFRIEPAEITAALKTCPDVADGVIVARKEAVGRRLVAYVVPAAGSGAAASVWRRYLAARLPDYMVPGAFVTLARLPLNANGKVDRAALPTPVEEPEDAPGDTEPRDEREQLVARAWCDVLGRASAGVSRNYFELGGDSITAIQIVARLKRAGWAATVRDLFEHPTVEGLARRLRRPEVEPAARPVDPLLADAPLSPVQRWFFDFHHGALAHFNQSVLVKCGRSLDHGTLRAALEALNARHDALHTAFVYQGAEVRQALHGEPPALTTIDLRGQPTAQIEAHAAAVQGRCDLSRGPLVRVVLFRCDEQDRLLLVAHHLVVDGVSWRILLDELQLACRQHGSGRPIELGPPPLRWQRWVLALHERAREEALRAELPYWQAVAAGARTLEFPRQAETPDNRHGDVQAETFALSEDETHGLFQEGVRAFEAEPEDLLLTALARALAGWGEIRACVLTLEGHGRDALGNAVDAGGTLGWFTSLYPFRLELAPEGGVREQILHVRAARRRVPCGGAGYGLLRHLAVADGLDYPARVSFNYLGQFGVDAATEDDPDWELASEGMGAPIAPELPRPHDLDLTAIVLGGRLNVSVLFHPGRHQPESMAALLAAYRRELVGVTEFCRGRPAEKPASNFVVGGLSQSTWDALRQRHGWAAEDIQDVHPTTPMQRGLLFHSLYDQQSRAYHLQMVFELRGAWNPEALRQAWDDLARRHATLRTAFLQEGLEHPLQVVLKQRPLPWTDLDLGEGSAPEQEAALERQRAAELARGFDLARDPLNRLTLLRLGPQRTCLVWSCHHALLDGWSLGVLAREFNELYRARSAGLVPDLPSPFAYPGYLRWLTARDSAASNEYWQNYLEGVAGVTSVPAWPEEAPSTAESAEFSAELDAELTSSLRALAASQGVTLNHVVQALWTVLLVRYNGTREALFGLVVSGRPAELPGAEDAVGLFINTIPVRAAAPPGLPFAELLRNVRDGAVAGEPHHACPLAEIQARSALGRDLISHLLIFENFPVGTVAGEDARGQLLTMRLVAAHDETHYPFNLVVTPGERLHLKLSYHVRTHSQAQAQAVVGHLEAAARVVAGRPSVPVGEIDILPVSERAALEESCGRPIEDSELGGTVSARLAAQAARTPEATALRTAGAAVTYAGLQAHAAAVAGSLRAHGVAPGDRVGVLLDRSPALVASLLGAWGARAAYVPMDPGSPDVRLRELLQASGCRALLTDRAGKLGFVPPEGCAVLDPTGLAGAEASPPLAPAPSDIAYVIYTSGSTGQPKGCEITHGNLWNYLSWVVDALHPGSQSGSYALFTSVAFDLTVTSLFAPLLLGRSLYLFPQEADLADSLRAAFDGSLGIDSVKCTPTHVEALKALNLTHSPVRVCILGGEALTRDQTDFLHALQPAMSICNEYGPAETTVGCIAAVVPPGAGRIVIGRPISHTAAFILDRDGHPAPVGVPGEVVIGGAGVGRGYLGRAAATAERFVPDPTRPGARRYRTGDLGRRLPDSQIAYLGRSDDQIKIRGHRVEPGETQALLAQVPGVHAAAVVAQRCGAETELVAYVVGAEDPARLQAHCRERLPSHQCPARIVPLDALPLTPNGKLDRRRLPEVAAPAGAAATIPARTATEAALVRIWGEVLGQAQVGTEDDFFALGGHSLKAIQVLARIHQRLGRQASLRDLFAHPTIAALARLLDGQTPSAWQEISPAPPRAHYPLSDAQQRLWLLARMGAGASLNTPEAISFQGPIDPDALERALRALAARHESLRTAFVVVNGQPRQRINPEPALHLRRIDLRAEADPGGRAKELADQDAAEPFDLERAPLLRATLLDLPGGRGLLLLNTHHLVVDGWSRLVFYREAMQLYAACLHGRPDPLPSLRIQYKDFAEWQAGRDFSREAAHWAERLAGVPDEVVLPTDFPAAKTRQFLGAAETLELSAELTAAVRRFARERGVLVSHLLLALFKLTLYHHTRQADLCVGLSSANRNRPETESIIGFFVNILPIRVQIGPEMEFDELLAEVVARTNEALEFQDYPFDRLVRKLNPPRRAGRPPLINVVYSFHDFHDVRFDLGEAATVDPGDTGVQLTESAWELAYETTKFDLTLFVTDQRAHLSLLFEYDRTLFRKETARAWLATLEKLTRSVVCPVPSA